MRIVTRRQVLIGASSLTVGLALARAAGARQAPAPAQPADPAEGDNHRGPCSVASYNGLRCVERAHQLVLQGYDPADAVVQAVRIIEDDPADNSVGFGGLPNEDGIVELDASVMHGPTHKSGAVAGLRNIKNPAMVALDVLRRTDHCLLVGEGALRFARQMGFQEENLLTEESRQLWLKWKANASKQDDWLNDDEKDQPRGKVWIEPGRQPADPAATGSSVRWRQGLPYTTGTVHCSTVTPAGDIASVTSTSGLSWKIPGRIGDSPIIGAGNYCDNDAGAAGCTGRGEAAIVNLCAFRMVDEMARGKSPTEAALAVAKLVADKTKEKRLLNAGGRPAFNVTFYALRKDGAFGGAAIYGGENSRFAVHDSKGPRLVRCPFLFQEP